MEASLHVFTEFWKQAILQWREYTPWLAVWFGAHVLFETILPSVWPAIYDIFNLGAIKQGKKPLSRVALAKDIRTRAVATIFAIYIVGLAIFGVLRGDYSYLAEKGFYATTPLTVHMSHVAVGFFIWDLYVSVVDGFGPAFIFHGLACVWVFTVALGPIMHSMAFVALGFEASTPFLHLRRVLIMAGQSEGALFTAAQGAFAVTFFLARIAIGWPTCAAWAVAGLAEIRSPSANQAQAAIFFGYMALCASLSCLNAYWMYEIVGAALRSSGKTGVVQRSEPGSKHVKGA